MQQQQDDHPAAANEEPPRFQLKSWNAVSAWSWDVCTDTCAICRASLNEPSIIHQTMANPVDDSGLCVAFGGCGHVFHLDCLKGWLKTRTVCPLCNKDWEYAKIERITGGDASADMCCAPKLATAVEEEEEEEKEEE